MKVVLMHLSAIASALVLTVGAQAGGHPGHSGSSHMNNSRPQMRVSQHSVPHSGNFSKSGNFHSYTKFQPNRSFAFNKYGMHSLHYTHKYWSSKYSCWCCWSPYYSCWYFYEPCYCYYVPVCYLPQVYCAPSYDAAPAAASVPAPAPAIVNQQTTVNAGSPGAVPPAPPAGI